MHLMIEAAGLGPLMVLMVCVGAAGLVLHVEFPLHRDVPDEALVAASLML